MMKKRWISFKAIRLFSMMAGRTFVMGSNETGQKTKMSSGGAEHERETLKRWSRREFPSSSSLLPLVWAGRCVPDAAWTG